MKFIALLRCGRECLDEFIEIWNRRLSPGHTIKTLFPPHTIADSPKGYQGLHDLRIKARIVLNLKSIHVALSSESNTFI